MGLMVSVVLQSDPMFEVKGGFSRFGLIGIGMVDSEVSFEAVTAMDLSCL